MTKNKTRCPWAGEDSLYISYHDKEWGVPKADDQALFEKLVLEGFQAGLSWITVLRKREHFREVFDKFDANRIVKYGPKKIETLMTDPGIIRNRAKIEATLSNARAYLDLKDKAGFAAFLWDFVDGSPIQNSFRAMSDVPAETPLSKKVSKELKRLGFRFVGPTIAYAFMQSIGMVNDHLTNCHRHGPCTALGNKFKAPRM